MMPKMIDSIKQLLQKQYWKSIGEVSAKEGMELKDPQSKMRVTVTQLPSNGLVVDLPIKGRSHASIVNNGPGFRQSCDKLILIAASGGTDSYFIEMKKTLRFNEDGVPEKPCKQILCTVPVLDYLASMVEVHFQKKPKINRYFVVIAEKENPVKGIDKQKVKHNPLQECKYQNEKFKIIHSSSTIPLSKLR